MSNFLVIDKVSLNPTSFHFFKEFHNLAKETYKPIYENLKLSPEKKTTGASTPVAVNTHSLEISEKAQKRLKKSVNWLYYLAKKKTVINHNSKVLSDFKIQFITLTLPAKQKHASSYITSKYLNQLLIELDLKNYVWKLEFQGNGNVHYHIVTDKYCHYYDVRRRWNRIIEKDGYISDYKNKFQKMSLSDYLSELKNSNARYEDKLKWYQRGCREGWTNPNTVDVELVTNNKSISSYLAKYISKKPIKENFDKSLILSEPSNIRLWFQSRSLSKLKNASYYREEVNDALDCVIQNVENAYKKVGDYVTSFFFRLNEQNNAFKRNLYALLHENAKHYGYIPNG